MPADQQVANGLRGLVNNPRIVHPEFNNPDAVAFQKVIDGSLHRHIDEILIKRAQTFQDFRVIRRRNNAQPPGPRHALDAEGESIDRHMPANRVLLGGEQLPADTWPDQGHRFRPLILHFGDRAALGDIKGGGGALIFPAGRPI